MLNVQPSVANLRSLADHLAEKPVEWLLEFVDLVGELDGIGPSLVLDSVGLRIELAADMVPAIFLLVDKVEVAQNPSGGVG